MATPFEAFIAAQTDPMAGLHREFATGSVSRMKAETKSIKVKTILQIGKALESDIAKANKSVSEALEAMLESED